MNHLGLSQDLQKQKNAKIKQFLDSNSFTIGELPDNFHTWKRIVLALVTPQSLNVSNDYFATLMQKQAEEYTFGECLSFFKAAEMICYSDVKMFCLAERITIDQETYCAFLQELTQAVTNFNAISEPKQKAIDREFETKSHIANGTPKKNIYQ